MLSPGFLGTRADWLMDVVIVSLVVILPAIAYSWQRARQHDWDQHKKVQVWLTIILTIVVSLFELDLKLAGGMEVLTRESAYFGTPLPELVDLHPPLLLRNHIHHLAGPDRRLATPLRQASPCPTHSARHTVSGARSA